MAVEAIAFATEDKSRASPAVVGASVSGVEVMLGLHRGRVDFCDAAMLYEHGFYLGFA